MCTASRGRRPLTEGGGKTQVKHETVLDPLKLAKRITDKRRDDSELVGFHVFRGRPLPMFQPEATSANDILAGGRLRGRVDGRAAGAPLASAE